MKEKMIKLSLKEKLKQVFSFTNVYRFVISAILFVALAIPFAKFFQLLPITEVRPANSIPPVLGLVWGLPGALGITFGNLLSDIIKGYSFFICLNGAITNFLYAYIPYKIWYTVMVDENDINPYLTSVSKIIKFVIVVLIDSFVVTGLLSFIFETGLSFPGSSSSGQYLILFLNNFDMSLLFGVSLLIILEKMKVMYNVPNCKVKRKGTGVINYVADIALIVASVIGVVWYLLSSYKYGGSNQVNITYPLLIISYILSVPTVFKVYNYNYDSNNDKYLLKSKNMNFTNLDEDKTSAVVKVSIKTKVTIGFMLLAVVFIFITAVVTYNLTSGLEMLARWGEVYKVVGITINVLFIIAIIFLLYVEKNIVNQIEKLTKSAREFAQASSSNDELEPTYIDYKEGDEIGSLSASFNKMMRDITVYTKNIKKVTAEKERIGAELGVATNIQASMLPCIFPAFPERNEFDIFAQMTPAKEVGGDFYDYFLIGEDKLAMVIADVSGKGVPAALFMVIAKTLIKNTAQTGLTPKEILEKVNNQLCENNDVQMFVTVWIGILDIPTGIVTCSNAGHEYPIIQHGNGEYELLKDKHGFVLAGMEGARYKEYEIKLGIGDRLFVYTDGVAEATDANNQLYGTQRLLDVLNVHKEGSAEDIILAVKADVDKFVGEAPQFDDITMFTLRILPTEINNMEYITVKPDQSSMAEIEQFIEKYLELGNASMKIMAKMNIAVDEIFSNIILYSKATEVKVGCCLEDNTLKLRFVDNGVPYDPTSNEDPDITLNAEEREIGGLGIFMVKKIMDEVEYRCSGSKNVLDITKKLN